MYGLTIKCHLESYYNTEVSHGRLYLNLDDLVEMGLVEKNELGKRADRYELTNNGPQAVPDRFGRALAKFVIDDEHAEVVSELVENKL